MGSQRRRNLFQSSEKPARCLSRREPVGGLLRACCRAARCAPTVPCSSAPSNREDWMWIRRAKNFSLWMPDGSDPSNRTIEAATRDFGMNVVGNGGEKSNLVVDGLTFERTAGGGPYFFSNDDGGVGFSGIVVRNCTVTQTGTGHIDERQITTTASTTRNTWSCRRRRFSTQSHLVHRQSRQRNQQPGRRQRATARQRCQRLITRASI